MLVGTGAVTAKWVNGSTDLAGPCSSAASNVAAPPGMRGGRDGFWFACSDNAALNLTLNTTVAVAGHVTYEVVPSGTDAWP